MKVVGPKTDFCVNLAHNLQCDFVEMERRIFPDGEVNPRIKEAPQEVVLVNTLSSQDFDPNRYLLEYIFSVKNLTERGTQKIVLVMPYLPYSRQDAVFRKGESFTSKYVLEMFKELHIKDVFAVTFHLHRQKEPLVKDIDVYNVSGLPALGDYLRKRSLSNPLCVAPDEEAEKWAKQLADMLGGDTAVLKKERDLNTGSINVCGSIPQEKDVIIVDDMISTGGTVVEALSICEGASPASVIVCAVHGIFSRSLAWDVEIVTTNTIENPYARADVTPLVAKAVSQKI